MFKILRDVGVKIKLPRQKEEEGREKLEAKLAVKLRSRSVN